MAKDIFDIEKYWLQIEALDYKVSANTQAAMMTRLTRLLRLATRWLLRHQEGVMGFAEVQKLFAGQINAVRMMYPQKLPPDAHRVVR
jgi:glutamate dehydrogenase